MDHLPHEAPILGVAEITGGDEMTPPRFFTQWRTSRGKDKTVERLYVCAFWRVRGPDGKTKQQGCSISAEKHGLLAATEIAVHKAAKHVRVHQTPWQIYAGLTW
jgi:hypothetical protein